MGVLLCVCVCVFVCWEGGPIQNKFPNLTNSALSKKRKYICTHHDIFFFFYLVTNEYSLVQGHSSRPSFSLSHYCLIYRSLSHCRAYRSVHITAWELTGMISIVSTKPYLEPKQKDKVVNMVIRQL